MKAVRHLRSLGCTDIEFSPEDAGRSDPKFLYRVLAAVIEAGATTLNIPDTTGTIACFPHQRHTCDFCALCVLLQLSPKSRAAAQSFSWEFSLACLGIRATGCCKQLQGPFELRLEDNAAPLGM